MARKSEEARICDQCQVTQRYSTDNGGYYGGHPLEGWLHLNEHGGSSRLEDLRKKKDFDFCSYRCLGEFLKAKETSKD
jgi:hypothetical protein